MKNVNFYFITLLKNELDPNLLILFRSVLASWSSYGIEFKEIFNYSILEFLRYELEKKINLRKVFGYS